jgi:hypothetical protein
MPKGTSTMNLYLRHTTLLAVLMVAFVSAANAADPLPSWNDGPGVVTLSEIDSIWTTNQQAKPLKTLASKFAVVGGFH